MTRRAPRAVPRQPLVRLLLGFRCKEAPSGDSMGATSRKPAQMSWPTRDDLRLLASAAEQPCVSMYVPLRTSYSQQVGNARRFGQAIAHVADRLENEGLPVDRIDAWVGRLTELERDLRHPRNPPQGVGVFLDAGLTQAYRLAAPPSERVVVADCFALRERVQQVDLLQEPGAAPPASDLDPAWLATSLDRILAAAQRDGIKRLWTREGAAITGCIAPVTGRIGSAKGGDGDVLDALAARVLRAGGEVRVVGSERMPGAGSAAAELYEPC